MLSTILKNINIWLSIFQLHLIMNEEYNLIVMLVITTLSIIIFMYDSGKDKFINLF